VEDSKRLRQENAKLNLEVGTLVSENQASRKQAEAALAVAERIRMFVHQAGEVVAKAELFDEKVGIGSKPSGTWIALILTNYSEKLERVLEDMREVVNQVTDLRRQPERQDKAARAIGLGRVKFQGGSKPLQAFTSGKLQRTFDDGRLYWRGCNARVQGCPRTKGRKEGQEPREERPGRNHDFRVQGRIRIRRKGLSDTGSPPKAWKAGH
jgi:hypothetical protein